MKAATPNQGWRPTSTQELLVRAALLSGDDAVRAWEQWEPSLDFDTLEACSRQLLPLLHGNLRAHGIDYPLMDKFKGIHRYSWYKNQLVLNKTAARLRAFHDAGIKTMLLKGAALVLQHYDTYGLRPMRDIDVLVPTGKALEAMALLEEWGFSTWYSVPPEFTTAYAHSWEFRDPEGDGFDLHWNALCWCRQADADDAFWDNAVETELSGVPALVPSPAEQLLHVCVHAARWSPEPPLIWIADATAILNTSPSIDWDRIVQYAQSHRVTLPLRDTLEYLRDLLDAPIPPAILQRLQEASVTKAEHTEYRIANSPQGRLTGPARLLWLKYRWHQQSPGGAGFQHNSLGFPRFLQRCWATPRLWQLPFYAAAKLARRI